jgi:anti-anti-sigma factor
MALETKVTERNPGFFMVALEGRLDSHTYEGCEAKLAPVLESDVQVLMFEMGQLSYISSMGLRVILKARKAVEGKGGSLIMAHLQPQIAKVFEIANALPDVNIFESVEEADRYLDLMQRRELDRQQRTDFPG